MRTIPSLAKVELWTSTGGGEGEMMKMMKKQKDPMEEQSDA